MDDLLLIMIESTIQIFHAADNNVFKLGAIKPYSAALFEYSYCSVSHYASMQRWEGG